MTSGVEFRTLRESRGLTIDRISSATRIPVRMIEALEHDDLRALPPRPFLRGFVAAYGRELGLDPADAVTRYFAQLEPPPTEAAVANEAADLEPRHTRAWSIAALVLVVVFIAPSLNRWRATLDIPRPEVAGTAGSVPAPAPAPASAPASAPATLPAAAPAPTAQGTTSQARTDLVVSLAFERRCWVSASTDGTRVLYRTMEPGTTQVLQARNQITIRVGDAGAVALTVNGGAPVPMGAAGEVRTVVLTPDNRATAR